MAQDTAQLNTTRVFAALVVLGAFGMALFGLVGTRPKSAPTCWRTTAWPKPGGVGSGNPSHRASRPDRS